MPPSTAKVDSSRLVYVDQWCWRELGLARQGRKNHSGLSQRDYESVRSRVWAQELVLPLSQVHHRETMGTRSSGKRAESVVAMAELSGFAVFDMAELDHWEAHVAVARIAGVAPPPLPRLINWGVESAYPPQSALASALAPEGISEEHLAALPTAPWSEPVEPPKLCRPEWVAEQLLWLLDVPRSEDKSRFVEEETKRRDFRGALPKAARPYHDDLVRVHTLQQNAGRIGLACHRLGVSPTELQNYMGRDPSALLNEMPITRVFQGLLDVAHRSNNRNWSKRASDELDFLYVAAAAGLFDCILVDQETRRLANSLPQQWFHAMPTTDLRSALIDA